MPGFEVFGAEEKKEIAEVLDTGVLFRYEFPNERRGIYKVRQFEEEFARYCGVKHAQAVTSGTAALKVALAAMGVGPGDEVITQGFTFVATWEAIFDVGAVPVFAEVDDTLNLDPTDLEAKITPQTRAIIPVHMMGAPARMAEIMAIADRHGIPVLEDTAQAPGTAIDGKKCGSFGLCGTFSFDPVKTMTTGEGGMIITDDQDLWRRMSEYQDHGHDHVPNPGARGGEGRSFIGFNYRMMELQGAIGLAQLAKLDHIIAAQRRNKEALRQVVSRLPGVTFRTVLDPAGDNASFLAFFLPDAASALKVNETLAANGAGAVYFANNTWHYYPKWEHLLAGSTLAKSGWPFKVKEGGADGRRRVHYDPRALPKSAAIMDRLLVYPVPIKLSEERLEQIEQAVKAAC
ncbi:DegT/DnrJ/EryC1/StrS family aminotransferase [Desulfurivibrio dismutans]|uniref:DegT/DnrJ/EryC1/StrS family aminotransferase n=1 Tax=Desulfurivibrio dismutans TaxID=1398908 RepID=UPI0023DC77A3|nr:DegT/DnrJ/EryC1/StrS family aminotransferase [Desulfurivibrio alkaliphilus]MDF1614910.1 DegT/DnrJ/EryC1/StrS family aminotransferase [Desulfurivibrio alkaliphilus]